MSDAVLGAVTSGAGAALGFLGQQQANATNVRIAREQMAFQERMSSSAHTRNRADLERAGLNPMLAVGGPGASSPVGASARVENAPGAGLHSGLAVKQSQAQVDLLKSQTDLHRQQAFTEMMTRGGRVGELQSKIQLMDMDTLTKQKLLPLVADHMSASIARDLASALAAKSHAGLLDAEAILKRFEQQFYKNMSEAQKSWYMRNVNPYMSSVQDVVRTGAQVGTAIGVGRGARAIGRSSAAGSGVRASSMWRDEVPVGDPRRGSGGYGIWTVPPKKR